MKLHWCCRSVQNVAGGQNRSRRRLAEHEEHSPQPAAANIQRSVFCIREQLRHHVVVITSVDDVKRLELKSWTMHG